MKEEILRECPEGIGEFIVRREIKEMPGPRGDRNREIMGVVG